MMDASLDNCHLKLFLVHSSPEMFVFFLKMQMNAICVGHIHLTYSAVIF